MATPWKRKTSPGISELTEEQEEGEEEEEEEEGSEEEEEEGINSHAADANAKYDNVVDATPPSANKLQQKMAQAEGGDVQAQLSLGISFLAGVGVGKDEAEAVKWLGMAAAEGDARASFNLGTMQLKGQGGLAADAEKAAALFRAAAEEGYTAAKYHYGLCCLAGRGVARDLDAALKYMLEAGQDGLAKAKLKAAEVMAAMAQEKQGEGAEEAEAEGGEGMDDAEGAGSEGGSGGGGEERREELLREASEGGVLEAKFQLGMLLLRRRRAGEGEGGREAMEWLQRAAVEGHAGAQLEVGQALVSKGGALSEEAVEGAAWIEKAAKAGQAAGQLAWGKLLMEGCVRRTKGAVVKGRNLAGRPGALVQECDPAGGMAWVRKAAAQGSAAAQYVAAVYGLEERRRGERDEGEWGMSRGEAMEMLRGAAGQGHGGAQWLLSVRLAERAQSVPRGKERRAAQRVAREWLERASEGGVAEAQAELGRVLRDGRLGVVCNASAAERWLRQAARRGVAQAQVDLALAIDGGEEGKGKKQEAESWLEKAAGQGHAEAQFELGVRMLNGKLGSEGGSTRGELGVAMLQLAARAGYPGAWLEYGRCLRHGLGGAARNVTGAVVCLRRASVQGSGQALVELASLLLEGKSGAQRRRDRRAAAEVQEGLECLRAAAAQGVEGAGELLVAEAERLGERAGAGGGRWGNAHLEEGSPLHGADGRLRVSVLQARNLPKVRRGRRGRGERSAAHAFVKLRPVTEEEAAEEREEEGEEEEEEDWEVRREREDIDKDPWELEPESAGLLWTRVRKGVRANGDRREEPMQMEEVVTKISSRPKGPVWNQSFAAYLNGSTGVWQRPIAVEVCAWLGGRERHVRLGAHQVMPWRVPLGRRVVKWCALRAEGGGPLRGEDGQPAEVQLELSRGLGRPPQRVMAALAPQKEFSGAGWLPPTISHVEMALRREQAKVVTVRSRPTDVWMPHLEKRVPYEWLSRFNDRSGTREPLVGRHRSLKFFDVTMGDFEEKIDADVWSERTADGRWVAPGGEAAARREDGDWHRWLKSYTQGRLDANDVMPGTLAPWLRAKDVRRQVNRLVREKEAAAQAAQVLRREEKEARPAVKALYREAGEWERADAFAVEEERERPRAVAGERKRQREAGGAGGDGDAGEKRSRVRGEGGNSAPREEEGQAEGVVTGERAGSGGKGAGTEGRGAGGGDGQGGQRGEGAGGAARGIDGTQPLDSERVIRGSSVLRMLSKTALSSLVA